MLRGARCLLSVLIFPIFVFLHKRSGYSSWFWGRKIPFISLFKPDHRDHVGPLTTTYYTCIRISLYTGIHLRNMNTSNMTVWYIASQPALWANCQMMIKLYVFQLNSLYFFYSVHENANMWRAQLIRYFETFILFSCVRLLLEDFVKEFMSWNTNLSENFMN
jgi:hypothetical protein